MVGYTVADVRKRLQQTMPPGYTWDDFMSAALHIDHKIPLIAFNFSSPYHADFRRAWALPNLQLLPADDNWKKNARLSAAFQPSLQL